MTSSRELRRAFLDFYAGRGHTIVRSSSLVPGNDPTLMFTNSGMVQFKDVFLGADQRPYARAASAQRCLRAGGKHNDLDQVGYTARHHTFFEMLGNFSFGDYFKREAIESAWSFLTGVLKLPADKLWVTVYATDDEAYDIWANEVGVPADRIIRIGDNKGAPYASDNFWQMADTGPCGPCSELFYDHGPDVAGGPPGSADADGDRYIEIWNLVFMQYDRAPDGTLSPLPKPCVDTGMGLERLAAVLQHVHSNYATDSLRQLIDAARVATGYQGADAPSLNVIADHIRACAFLVVDGVLPSNEGRGYVLRRIIRRAARHGYQLGQRSPFFHRLVGPLVAELGDAYPELAAKASEVAAVLEAEEQRFAETLGNGLKVYEQIVQRAQTVISGGEAFRLYDTFGFPLDLTQDLAREQGLTVDVAGFDAAMEAQRQRAREASQFGLKQVVSAEQIATTQATLFVGYEQATVQATIVAILRDGQGLDVLDNTGDALVVLDKTPFYAESGGQVGDTGSLIGRSGRALVSDTIKLTALHYGHRVRVSEGLLQLGDVVEATIDEPRRQAIRLNHSATHLLHAALRQVLGPHVQQRGSLVAADRLRFDYSHPRPLKDEERRRIEALVNDQIRRNSAAEVSVLPFDQAIASGAMALFDEKYGDQVRVLRFGDFSLELCGGTHVSRVGDIGLFRITTESGVAAGIRRIEAVTGAVALDQVEQQRSLLEAIGEQLKSAPDTLVDKTKALLERVRKLERELESARGQLTAGDADKLLVGARLVSGTKVLVIEQAELDAKSSRDLVDQLKNKLKSGVVVIGTRDAGRASFTVGVTADLAAQLPAGNLAQFLAGQVGGRGGGRADFAQAGGPQADQLSVALASVENWLESRVTGTAESTVR